MPKCDLEIVIDGAEHPAGGTVKGFVAVTVNEDCPCKALTVSRFWRTSGRGNRATGAPHTEVLHSGTLTAGDERVFPFELPIPRGPLTYDGHLLHVGWHLAARADVPWAIDPKAEVDLVVVDDGGEEPLDDGGAPDPAAILASFPLAVVAPTVTGVFALIFSLAFLVTSMSFLLPAIPEEPWMLAFAAIFAVVPCVAAAFGARMLYRTWGSTLAERRLGRVEVVVPDHPLRASAPIPITVRFTPRAALPIRRIAATLRGAEVVVSGSSEHQRTYTHTLHEETVVLASGLDTRPGHPVAITGRLEVPAGAPPSFSAPNNGLRWSVRVDVDIPLWPGWSRDTAIAVRGG